MVVKRGQTSQCRGKFKEKNSLKHALLLTPHTCPALIKYALISATKCYICNNKYVQMN